MLLLFLSQMGEERLNPGLLHHPQQQLPPPPPAQGRGLRQGGHERENLRNIIQQWNANRLDLFEISEPNEVSNHRQLPCVRVDRFVLQVRL